MIFVVCGLESFKGDYFYFVEWWYDVDLSVKCVVSIGNVVSVV